MLANGKNFAYFHDLSPCSMVYYIMTIKLLPYTVFTSMSARGAHLILGLWGGALIRGRRSLNILKRHWNNFNLSLNPIPWLCTPPPPCWFSFNNFFIYNPIGMKFLEFSLNFIWNRIPIYLFSKLRPYLEHWPFSEFNERSFEGGAH